MSRADHGFRVVGMWTHSARAAALPILPALLLLAAAPPAFAQLPFVGLSSVGGQAFGNEDLLFYVPEGGELFGAAVVAGDFNGDGIDDLATGIPFDNGFANDPIPGCGAVVVRYGWPGGRLEAGLADTFLNQLASGSPDPAEFAGCLRLGPRGGRLRRRRH